MRERPSNKGMNPAKSPQTALGLRRLFQCSTGLRVALLLLAVGASAACRDYEAQQQLVTLYERITANTSASDIERWATEPAFAKLKVHNFDTEVRVMTPVEFGVDNWQICMELKDKRVIRARIGTVDSCGEKLPTAPPPKQFGT